MWPNMAISSIKTMKLAKYILISDLKNKDKFQNAIKSRKVCLHSVRTGLTKDGFNLKIYI
jgi:hypothetical protein